MLHITGTTSLIALMLLIFFMGEEPIDYPSKFLLDDLYLQGPVVQECNFEYSPASILKRNKEKLRRNSTRFSISMNRSEYFLPRNLRH
jgi:hypothetical protein